MTSNLKDHYFKKNSDLTILDFFRKILKIIEPREKVTFYLVFLYQVFYALMELLATALLPIFINSLIYTESTKAKIYELKPNFLKINFSDNEFIIYVGAFVLFIYILKNILFILIIKQRYSFINSTQIRFSSDIFRYFLNSKYEKILQNNSSKIISTVNNDAINSITISLVAVINLISSSLVSLFILGYLLYYDFFITIISISILTTFSIIYIKIFKERADAYGRVERENKERFIEIVSTAINGIIEVILLNKSKFFMSRFLSYSKQTGNAFIFKNLLNLSSKPIFETIGVFIIIALCSGMILIGEDKENIILLMTLYGVAFLKLVPISNEILAQWATIQFSKSYFDRAYSEYVKIENKKTHEKKILNFEEWETLELKNIRFSYFTSNVKTKNIIDGISLLIKKGQYIGIAGKTGCGKSTLVNIILGLLIPKNGSILIDKTKINFAENNINNFIGYIPQTITFLDSTIKDNIAYGEDDHKIDMSKVIKVSKIAGIHNFIQSLAKRYETKIGENAKWLSGGQRQRIGIARALYFNPKIIIMDEATSALDDETEKDFLNSLDKLSQNCTLIVIAHRHTTLRRCDKIYFIENGKIKHEGDYDYLDKKVPSFRLIDQ